VLDSLTENAIPGVVALFLVTTQWFFTRSRPRKSILGIAFSVSESNTIPPQESR